MSNPSKCMVLMCTTWFYRNHQTARIVSQKDLTFFFNCFVFNVMYDAKLVILKETSCFVFSVAMEELVTELRLFLDLLDREYLSAGVREKKVHLSHILHRVLSDKGEVKGLHFISNFSCRKILLTQLELIFLQFSLLFLSLLVLM